MNIAQAMNNFSPQDWRTKPSIRYPPHLLPIFSVFHFMLQRITPASDPPPSSVEVNERVQLTAIPPLGLHGLF
jgi:hypothetical protein